MLYRRYNPLVAYKQSKLCNMLFAKGLNEHYAAEGIHAYVVDPGLVNTDIGNKETGMLVNFIWSLRKRYGVSPAVPAKTYAFLCEQSPPPDGLYYYLCKEKKYSRQVTSQNADRLFALSERLCGIQYGKVQKL
jgi:retinol dehydrogenase-13